MSKNLRQIDKEIASSQKFFGDLEVLDNHKLRRLRSMLVAVFVIGFTAAIFWVAANNYGEYSHGQESCVLGVSSISYVDESGNKQPVVVSNIVKSSIISKEMDEVEAKEINNNIDVEVKVVQEVNKTETASGDSLIYTLNIINGGINSLNDLVLYALIPNNVELDTSSLSGDSYYDERKRLLMWNLESLEGVEKEGDEEVINRNYKVVVK